MTITIDIRFLRKELFVPHRYFVYEVFTRIAEAQPTHQFVFICDKVSESYIRPAKNLHVLTVRVPNQFILSRHWLNHRLPGLLTRRNSALHITSIDGGSLKSKTPQWIVYDDGNTEVSHARGIFTKTKSKYQKKMIGKAEKIIAVTESSDIDETDAHSSTKMLALSNAALQDFKKSSTDEVQRLKEKYTESKEYLLYCGDITVTTIDLLKAFSIFKKRQQTSMKLWIVHTPGNNHNFLKSLESFKYRNDIIVTPYTKSDFSTILSGAYGVLSTSAKSQLSFPFPEAAAFGIPIITIVGSPLQRKIGEACFLSASADKTGLAEQMMMLYKDENGRKQKIENAREIALLLSWDKIAIEMWELIKSNSVTFALQLKK